MQGCLFSDCKVKHVMQAVAQTQMCVHAGRRNAELIAPLEKMQYTISPYRQTRNGDACTLCKPHAKQRPCLSLLKLSGEASNACNLPCRCTTRSFALSAVSAALHNANYHKKDACCKRFGSHSELVSTGSGASCCAVNAADLFHTAAFKASASAD